MKTFSQFLEEALISSLIKAAARQFVKSKVLQKAIPKVKTIPMRSHWTNKAITSLPVQSNAPEKVKLASNITGFRSGGQNRGSNFDPMKGSKYQFDPVNRTSISNTAPGHISTPAGIKPKSTRTYFDTPKNIQVAKQNRDLSTLGTTPKIGLNPYEKWKIGDYPAGVEYSTGKFSEPNWSPSHMGSPIVDIQTQTLSKNNLPLFGAERDEIKKRVAAGLKNKANQDEIKRELGINPIKEQKTFSQFIVEANEIRSPKDLNPQVSESKVRQDNESSRYEDDVYRSTQQKLANPRLKKLRRFFNRELGRYTI